MTFSEINESMYKWEKEQTDALTKDAYFSCIAEQDALIAFTQNQFQKSQNP